jgi:hypothetical protein
VLIYNSDEFKNRPNQVIKQYGALLTKYNVILDENLEVLPFDLLYP